MSNFHDVTSADHLKELLSQDLERVSLLSFWAPWAEPCKQMNEVVKELSKKYESVLVISIEAEQQSDIAESFDIEAVPSFVLLRGHTLLGKIAGADAAALTKAVAEHARQSPQALSKTDKAPANPPALPDSMAVDSPSQVETEAELEERMKNLMKQSDVVVFMKGNPDAPRCGFSRKTVALLREQKVGFTHFDILSDEAVRQGLKKLNDWPTFPQLIVKGEFFGGLDVLKESIETGEFKEVIDTI